MNKSKLTPIETIQLAVDNRLLSKKNIHAGANSDIDLDDVKDWNIDKLWSLENNEQFIEIAYQLVLRRKVDPVGLQVWLDQLDGGRFDRIAFIETLIDSDEGVKCNAYLSGFEEKKDIEKRKSSLGCIPVIGNFLSWLSQLFSIKRTVKKLHSRVNSLEQRLELSEKRSWDALEYAYARQYALSVGSPHQTSLSEHDDSLPKDYIWKFFIKHAEKFRGSEQTVAKLCEVYRPMLEQSLKDNSHSKTLLDIGCGRGEVLGFANTLGFEVIGLDTNKAAVDYCKQKGFDAFQEDALLFLQKQNEGTFAGITSIHVVEHLDFIYLMKLLKEIHRALAYGGCVLLETPNPENLVVSAAQFYLDPTHKHPVPQALLQLMMEFSGFKVSTVDLSSRYVYSENVKDRSDDPQLNYMLTCSQDYALVGFKI